MKNLKKLTMEELQNLMEEVKKEINSREVKSCIYLTDDYDAASSHLKNNKHWAKVITDIDTTKANGYAFVGEFLQYTKENLVPLNSLIVELDTGTYTAYRVTGDNQKSLLVKESAKNLVTFIKKVKELV